MPSFYRRRVTGQLQMNEFLMNGPGRAAAMPHLQSCVNQRLEGPCLTVRLEAARFREERVYFRGIPVADRRGFRGPWVCPSLSRKQSPARSEERRGRERV